MKRWAGRIVALAVFVLAAVWFYHRFFPSPEVIIRKELGEMAVLASFKGNEAPLVQMSHSQKLSAYFTSDATVGVDIPNRGRQTFTGRDTVLQAAMGARTFLGGLKVDLSGIEVRVNPAKTSATANFTAQAGTPADKYFLIQELKATFQKVDREWLVSGIETVKTLSDAPAQSPK
jgi:hypothetical protein